MKTSKFVIGLGLIVAAAWTLPACGGDDEESNSSGGTGGASGSGGTGGGTGGTGGGTGGTAGGGTGGTTSTGGTGGGTGGTAGGGTGGTGAGVTCGSNTCNAFSLAGLIDIAACCVDSASTSGPLGATADGCGLDSTPLSAVGISAKAGHECQGANQPGSEDAACVGIDVDTGVVGVLTLPGCCLPNNKCGVATAIDNTPIGPVDLGLGCVNPDDFEGFPPPDGGFADCTYTP